MDLIAALPFLNHVPDPRYIISIQMADYSTQYLHGYSRLLYVNEYNEPCDDGYDYYTEASRKLAVRISEISDALDVMAFLLADGFKVSIELEEGKE